MPAGCVSGLQIVTAVRQHNTGIGGLRRTTLILLRPRCANNLHFNRHAVASCIRSCDEQLPIVVTVNLERDFHHIHALREQVAQADITSSHAIGGFVHLRNVQHLAEHAAGAGFVLGGQHGEDNAIGRRCRHPADTLRGRYVVRVRGLGGRCRCIGGSVNASFDVVERWVIRDQRRGDQRTVRVREPRVNARLAVVASIREGARWWIRATPATPATPASGCTQRQATGKAQMNRCR